MTIELPARPVPAVFAVVVPTAALIATAAIVRALLVAIAAALSSIGSAGRDGQGSRADEHARSNGRPAPASFSF